MTSRPKQLALEFRESPTQLLSPNDIFDSADETLLRRLPEDRPLERKRRDPKAFFRLRSSHPLPSDAYEQEMLD